MYLILKQPSEVEVMISIIHNVQLGKLRHSEIQQLSAQLLSQERALGFEPRQQAVLLECSAALET